MFGLVANCLSLILSLIACLSLSLNFDLIVAAGFTRGLVYVPSMDLPLSRIWIGLRGVAVRNFKGRHILTSTEKFVEGDIVISFDSFCDYIDDGLENYIDPEDCDSCASASNGLVTAVIFSTILILPNITTDILRMYPNYDLNCQKVFGSLVSVASALLSLYAWRGYATECYKSFKKGESSVIPFYSNGTLVMEEELEEALQEKFTFDGIIQVFLQWQAGTGLICIYAATLLKFVDIVAVCMIPTPDIAHTRSLQDEYELLYGGTDAATATTTATANICTASNSSSSRSDRGIIATSGDIKSNGNRDSERSGGGDGDHDEEQTTRKE